MMPARAGAARACGLGRGHRPARPDRHLGVAGPLRGGQALAKPGGPDGILLFRRERPVPREPMLPLMSAVHSATARAARRCATIAIRMPSTPTAGPATDGPVHEQPVVDQGNRYHVTNYSDHAASVTGGAPFRGR
jgi:hypothetical protein